MIKNLTIIATLFTFCATSFSNTDTFKFNKTNCAVSLSDQLNLYDTDFSWNIDYLTMKNKFKEIYKSKKRLIKRVYFDNSKKLFKAELPLTEKEIIIPKRFIVSITHHIEKALRQGYADFIIFPDMGHNHFHIPNKIWNESYSMIDDINILYSQFVNEPSLKMLYHTAEQLKLTDDENRILNDTYVQRRYYTRNIVGDNRKSETLDIYFAADNEFNTVRSVPDHTMWSAGVNISASSAGCFPYKHNNKTYYFDISFYDLTSGPGNDFVYFKSLSVAHSLKNIFKNGLIEEKYRPPLKR